MIQIIETLLYYLSIIAIISFLILCGFIIRYQLYYGKRAPLSYFIENKYFGISVIVVIISFISIFSLSFYESKLCRTEIKDKIEKLNDKKFTLIINDTIRKNDNLIVALKNIKEETGERSTGSLEINVKIKNRNEIIKLILLRDFTKKTTYWVFYKNYASTTKNCIGEINTESLNEYQ
ncbi:hypothetical protein [Flavobacterium aquicola]|uniref:Uncharacterized protein n=1 Tax=Flavobacterium aquicola TaxID=1682742 RepID=A0A3E0E1A2_9FLAO|nr:hypothetical protein [Flavobacterium aquicola]REG91109.1 hypothetical protein C8P67_1171 [Flavobacterium aquicola]